MHQTLAGNAPRRACTVSRGRFLPDSERHKWLGGLRCDPDITHPNAVMTGNQSVQIPKHLPIEFAEGIVAASCPQALSRHRSWTPSSKQPRQLYITRPRLNRHLLSTKRLNRLLARVRIPPAIAPLALIGQILRTWCAGRRVLRGHGAMVGTSGASVSVKLPL
jgi:hypothetical protein